MEWIETIDRKKYKIFFACNGYRTIF